MECEFDLLFIGMVIAFNFIAEMVQFNMKQNLVIYSSDYQILISKNSTL